LLAFVQWATALSSLKPALSTQSEAISYLFFFHGATFQFIQIYTLHRELLADKRRCGAKMKEPTSDKRRKIVAASEREKINKIE